MIAVILDQNIIIKFDRKVAHGRSHYAKYLWNATFGLWKIRIMNALTKLSVGFREHKLC